MTITEFIGLVLARYTLRSGADCLDLTIMCDVWHRQWRRAQRYRAYFPVLERLHFDDTGAFPYSRELALAMDNLILAGVLAPAVGSYRIMRYDDTAEVVATQCGDMSNDQCRILDQLVEMVVEPLVSKCWQVA